jgi:hypothetical protein
VSQKNVPDEARKEFGTAGGQTMPQYYNPAEMKKLDLGPL